MTSPWRSMSNRERLHFVTGHWRYAVPAVASVIAIGLMAVPVFTPTPSIPHLALLVVYIWAAFQPTMMPPWLAFLLGLLADLWLALPLGINATLLPLLALVASFVERRFGHRPFIVDWLLVVPVVLLYQLLAAQLVGFARGPVPWLPLLVQVATTVLAYPIVALACARVQQRWIDEG